MRSRLCGFFDARPCRYGRPGCRAPSICPARRPRTSLEVGTGEVRQLIIEPTSARLLILPLTEHCVLGLGSGCDGNLGRARPALERLDDDPKPLLER